MDNPRVPVSLRSQECRRFTTCVGGEIVEALEGSGGREWRGVGGGMGGEKEWKGGGEWQIFDEDAFFLFDEACYLWQPS